MTIESPRLPWQADDRSSTSLNRSGILRIDTAIYKQISHPSEVSDSHSMDETSKDSLKNLDRTSDIKEFNEHSLLLAQTNLTPVKSHREEDSESEKD